MLFCRLSEVAPISVPTSRDKITQPPDIAALILPSAPPSASLHSPPAPYRLPAACRRSKAMPSWRGITCMCRRNTTCPPASSLNCCTVMPSALNAVIAARAIFRATRATWAKSSAADIEDVAGRGLGDHQRYGPTQRGMTSREGQGLVVLVHFVAGIRRAGSLRRGCWGHRRTWRLRDPVLFAGLARRCFPKRSRPR